MEKGIYDEVAYLLRNNDYEQAFDKFSLIYGIDLSDKKKIVYDDMVLLLFSTLMDLDDNYQWIARNIRLDEFSSYYDKEDINNKLYRDIYNRYFKTAIKHLIDTKERKGVFNSKETILLELLNSNKKKQEECDNYILDLISNNDYSLASTLLDAKNKVRGLSKEERTTLYALKKIQSILETREVPTIIEDDNINNIMYAVTTNNFHRAVYLQTRKCNKGDEKLNSNCLYVILNNICNVIYDISGEKEESCMICNQPLNSDETSKTLVVNKDQNTIFKQKNKPMDEPLIKTL